MPCFSRVANGNITPSSFVKLDTTTEGRVLQCGAGNKIYGIAQPGTRMTPLAGLDDGNAAIAGENLMIYGPPEKDVMLTLGGTVTRGDSLKSDGSGFGITTTSTGDWIGAIALDSGVANDIIPVQVIPPTQY